MHTTAMKRIIAIVLAGVMALTAAGLATAPSAVCRAFRAASGDQVLTASLRGASDAPAFAFRCPLGPTLRRCDSRTHNVNKRPVRANFGIAPGD